MLQNEHEHTIYFLSYLVLLPNQEVFVIPRFSFPPYINFLGLP